MSSYTLEQLSLRVASRLSLDETARFHASRGDAGFRLWWNAPGDDSHWLETARGAPRYFKTLDACWSAVLDIQTRAQRPVSLVIEN